MSSSFEGKAVLVSVTWMTGAILSIDGGMGLT
jgi:hypothetical protein